MSETDRPGTTYNLLFVCTGNTCRSPMAAAIARNEIETRGWTHVDVRSAGTAAAAGHAAAPEAVTVLESEGIDLQDHRSSTLTPELVAWADLILAMGPAHLNAVIDMGGGEKVAMITDFVDDGAHDIGIDDPYGSGEDAYRQTYEQLREAVSGLLERLEPILSP